MTNTFRLAVLVDGVALEMVEHQGRLYLPVPAKLLSARKEYSIQLSTPNYGRFEVVVSVDGKDIVSGEAASEQSRGYVRNPHQDLIIPGWRMNSDEVARFQFSPRRGSYASKMGAGENVGIIGARYYSEREQPVFRGGGDYGICQTRSLPGHDVGTAFGGRAESRVTTTEFLRKELVSEIFVEYASEERLKKAGIISKPPLGKVSAFPGDKKITGARPPKGWKG
jgi:hypothetical protein